MLIQTSVAALVTGVAFLSEHSGGGGRPPDDEPRAGLPERVGGAADSSADGERRADGLADTLGRALRMFGSQGGALRERLEGYYGMYRLLRALGMTEPEIAQFVAKQARERLERDVLDRRPTTANARRAMDGLQETVVRAAEEVDERLGLGGDFVRRVREGAQAATTGREDALVALERGTGAGREHLRKILNSWTPPA